MHTVYNTYPYYIANETNTVFSDGIINILLTTTHRGYTNIKFTRLVLIVLMLYEHFVCIILSHSYVICMLQTYTVD